MITIDVQYDLDACTTPAEYYAQMTQPVPGEWRNDQKPKPAPEGRDSRYVVGLALLALGGSVCCLLAGLAAGL